MQPLGRNRKRMPSPENGTAMVVRVLESHRIWALSWRSRASMKSPSLAKSPRSIVFNMSGSGPEASSFIGPCSTMRVPDSTTGSVKAWWAANSLARLTRPASQDHRFISSRSLENARHRSIRKSARLPSLNNLYGQECTRLVITCSVPVMQFDLCRSGASSSASAQGVQGIDGMAPLKFAYRVPLCGRR